MKKHLFTLFLAIFIGNIMAQLTYTNNLNISLIKTIDPEKTPYPSGDNRKYSGCWGWYQAGKNKEYAIVGTNSKTFFIDITNPLFPVINDSVMGKGGPCTWRELKTYQNYCYVVSDVCLPNTFQIIDMQYLPDSVHVVYEGTSYFERAHTVWVDANKLYVGAPTPFGAGGPFNMQVYSLATPSVPVLLRTLSQDYPSLNYAHDMFARRDTVYASCGGQGLQIYKLTGANTFTQLGSFTGYAQSGYNHSSYITPDGKTLAFCDETPSTSFKISNVTNLANITMSSMVKPNLNPEFVAHNPFVVSNKYVYVSCYQDGLLLYDISNPLLPTLAGYFDTYPQGGANVGNNYGGTSYRGNWGAYPYFPSGVVLACDMQNGVFLLQPSATILAGIKDESKATNGLPASIYPNPTQNNLNVNFSAGNAKNYSIQIENVLGQTIYREEALNDCNFPVTHKTIDVSELLSGAYFITIKADDKSFQQKFIISK